MPAHTKREPIDVDVRDYLTSKGCQLKEAGQDNVHLACMFCNEDPSKRGRLYINVGDNPDTAGLYYCHKCNESGNMRTLMRHYGDEPAAADRNDKPVSRVLEAACEYYQGQHTDQSINYLTGPARNLTRETIRDFRLGYAPQSTDGLYRFLTEKRGFSWDDIAKTGLVVERDGLHRDFFSDKIVIPYLASGQILQLRGKDTGGKYLTPPGQKARMFNGMVALKAAEVIVCEGEFDAMVLTQLGYHAVALPGAVSMQAAWADYFSNCDLIFTMFDPDAAGEKGTTKFLDALPLPMVDKARVLQLPVPEGVDPGDVDPSWLVGECKWTRDHFDALITEAMNKNTLLVSVHEARDEWESVQGVQGLQLGLGSFDIAIRPGLLPGQVMIPLAKTNAGKQEPLTATLPTPQGFVKMGDLAVGDEVFGVDGHPTKIVGVYPQGTKPVYRVTFTDHTWADVGRDHLWQVMERSGEGRTWEAKTMSTGEVLEAGLKKPGRREWRWAIPIAEPVQYERRDFDVDPYTLGALIANGTCGSGSIVLATPDEDVIGRVRMRHTANSHRAPDGACPRYGLPGMLPYIRHLGLNVKSRDKFIPEPYLLGSVEQRVDLFHGLMDGDGTAVKVNPNSVKYCTTSRRLAHDVAELVSSLSGTGKVIEELRKNGKVEFGVSIVLPDWLPAFSSKRKLSNVAEKPAGRYRIVPRRAITRIEYVGDEPCQCIEVAAPDHLYLTGRNYIVTHNTITMLNIFQRLTMVEGQSDKKILFLSLEQTRGDWFERARRIWNFYNLDCEPEKVNDETVAYWQDRIMLVDQNRVSEEQFLIALDDYQRIMGCLPDLVAIDYLGYWAQSFTGSSRYEKLSDAVMALKHVAKEASVPVIAPHQVSRGAEFGTQFQIDQGRDSGVIEETADFALSLWASDAMRGADLENRTGELGMELGKSRHGGKGQQFTMQFGYMTLAVVPQEDTKHARMARAEVPWAANGTITWQEAINTHRTGIPPRGFARADAFGGP